MAEQPPETIRTERVLSRRRVIGGAAALAAAGAAGALLGIESTHRSQPGSAPAPEAAVGVTQQKFPDDPRVRVQHLLRRAGFAPSEDEVQHGLQIGLQALTEELLNPEARPDGLPAALQTLPPTDPKPADLVEWWLARMALTRRPSLEKTTLFWHGLHTSGFDKLGPKGAPELYTQNTFQRANAYGNFADILKGISKQPAMMVYLDTITNVRAHPNENYARELMELFTLGIGNYSEDDVREAARAFTGFSVDPATRQFVFRAGQHDPGVKTLLGHSGTFSGDDVVDILVQHPAAAQFVARKVWSFFVSPTADTAVLAPVAQAFIDSRGDMRAVLRAVFAHPQFYADDAYRSLVKSPLDYGIGAFRQLGVQPQGGAALAAWVRDMGQVPFSPPNVAGWPGGSAWLGSGAFLARINGIDRLVFPRRAAGGAVATFDVAAYVDHNHISTVGDAVDHFAQLLVDGQISAAARSALVDYGSRGAGDSTLLSTLPAADRDTRVRGTVYLLMAGPDYQLA